MNSDPLAFVFGFVFLVLSSSSLVPIGVLVDFVAAPRSTFWSRGRRSWTSGVVPQETSSESSPCCGLFREVRDFGVHAHADAGPRARLRQLGAAALRRLCAVLGVARLAWAAGRPLAVGT